MPFDRKAYHREYTRKWRLRNPNSNKRPRPVWEQIALEVQDLLDIPVEYGSSTSWSSTRNSKTGKLIVKTIFAAIKRALLNGEDVWIREFGRFQVKTRRAHTRFYKYTVIGHGKDFRRIYNPRIVTISPKKYLLFTPAVLMEAMANEVPGCVPNATQKKALRKRDERGY